MSIGTILLIVLIIILLGGFSGIGGETTARTASGHKQTNGPRQCRVCPLVDRDALVELEARLREQHDGGAFRRDGRAGDHRPEITASQVRFARPSKMPLKSSPE
jgi:hypothetical protein